MSDYEIRRIFPGDRREMEKMNALLRKEGLERDQNLDYTVGLYDADGALAATGSCFGSTLRCLAVDSARQGEGLLNRLVSHLVQYQYSQGNIDLFLYTKCENARYFRDLGFYEIVRTGGQAASSRETAPVVFMENRKNGFFAYLEKLKKESGLFFAEPATASSFSADSETTAATLPDGAAVLNANPFTLGHLSLLQRASALCRVLHVFLVSEDASLFPADVRFRLAQEGSRDLPNLIFHRTGSYLISSATFPSYFLKDSEAVTSAQAELDAAVFARIAAALGISVRFLGEEPFSTATALYNQVLQKRLPENDIDCQILPRLSGPGGIISASAVRQAIREENWAAVREAVPDATYRFIRSPEAEDIRRAIGQAQSVIHH